MHTLLPTFYTKNSIAYFDHKGWARMEADGRARSNKSFHHCIMQMSALQAICVKRL